jgi:parallel beta-helix repeat protein
MTKICFPVERRRRRVISSLYHCVRARGWIVMKTSHLNGFVFCAILVCLISAETGLPRSQARLKPAVGSETRAQTNLEPGQAVPLRTEVGLADQSASREKSRTATTAVFATGGAATTASVPDMPGPSSTLYNGPFYTCLRNFYVATTGRDWNDGSQASPWRTIQHADSPFPVAPVPPPRYGDRVRGAGPDDRPVGTGDQPRSIGDDDAARRARFDSRQAGDCINVAPGTYEANVLIQHGGNAPTPTGYVVYRCEMLDGCHILAPGAGHLWGIEKTAFVVIDGFEFDGNNALKQDGIADVCVGSDGATYGTGNSAHHVWVLNNILHHCNLGGVDLNNKEWYYVIHNTVYHNAWTSGYQGSGIGFVNTQCIESGNASCASGSTYAGGTGTYVPSGMDLTYLPPFHNVVSKNVTYDNMIAADNPVACGAHTDGNGIIMDTFLDQTTESIVYPYQTLVAGNIAYANGGRGIHVFRASNVTVANNTVYGNGKDTCIDAYYLADLSQQGGSNNVWINNISQAVMVAKKASCGAYCGGRNAALIAGDAINSIDTNNTYSNNILYGANGIRLFNNDVAYFTCSKNLCNTNPMMVNPASANFAPAPGSPAVGYVLPKSYLPTPPVDAGACSSTVATCP